MIAIITGASSGMGREFVFKADQEENLSEIWVIARRADRLEELKKEIKTPLRSIPLDLTKKESLEELELLLKTNKPEIKLLVNCSGYGKFGKTQEISLDDSMGMIDLNCKALTAVTLLALPYMAQKGNIIELCSLSSFQPVPYLNVYGATKAYVLSFSRALNAELKGKVKVMAVCPGWVKTEFFARAESDDNTAVTYFNRFYTAKQVIDKAYKDMRRGKDVSICGFPVRAQVLLVKLLPHKLVMKIWLRQQNH